MTIKTLVTLTLLACLMAGCSVPWTIEHQATPNMILEKRTFALRAINFSGLRVGEKSEQAYLANKSAQTREQWVGDKLAINRAFANALTTRAAEAGIEIDRAGTGSLSIHARVRWLEPGFNVGVAQKRSKVRMTLQIRDSEGNVVDEIKLKHRTEAYTTRDRLKGDGQALGEIAASYLTLRVHGDTP